MKLATHCLFFILVCATIYFSIIVVHGVLHKRMKIATPPNPILNQQTIGKMKY